MENKLTIEEVAQKLKVSKRTILREIKRGKLVTERAGRRHLISEDALKIYLNGSSKTFNEHLANFLKNNKGRMVSYLQKIVSMPSITSELGQEEKLALYIKKTLEKWGIRSVVYKEGPAVAVRASFGFADEGILLDCPLDTLPTGDTKKWSFPPFEGVVKNGKMYGRGTADCKAGIVAQLFTLLFFKRFIDEEKIRIELVFDGGEQDGEFSGMKLVLGRGLPVKSGIIGYSGDQKELMYGARGYHRYKFTVEGKAVHTGSRYKKGINAISKINKFLMELEKVKLPASENSLFSFGNKLTVSQIEGGRAINMVPDECSAKVDFRTTPNVRKKDIDKIISECIKKIRGKDKDFLIKSEYLTGEEAFVVDTKEKLVDVLDQSIKEIIKTEPVHTASGPGNVGNLLAQFDIKTVVWGPRGENVHSYDEYIEIDSIPKTIEVYSRAVAKYFDIDDSSVLKNVPANIDWSDWS